MNREFLGWWRSMWMKPCAWRRCSGSVVTGELRLILLGLSVLLLLGIWWWGARRSSQSPGNPELRDITPPLEPARMEPSYEEPPLVKRETAVASHDYVPAREYVRPFEPLSMRANEDEGIPIIDEPMLADPER